MSVAFKSQTYIIYKRTVTIEWYGDTVIGYVQQHYTNAIDFTFEANNVDYTKGGNKIKYSEGLA